MRWTSRLAGFPIYYSYVAPPRNEDDILIAGTTGQWYILYYVLTWQRWLIADAREGAAHGGLSFLGDTLDELVSALHRAGPHSVAGDYTTDTTSWHFQVSFAKSVAVGLGLAGLSMPMNSCALRMPAVCGRLVGGPDVQINKGPVRARIRGDNRPGPVPGETVDLDGAPCFMPIIVELCCASHVYSGFDVGLPPSAGPETKRGRAVRRDGRMRRLQHGRMPAWEVQQHDISMRVRIWVRSSEQRCGCKTPTPFGELPPELAFVSAAGISGKLARHRSSPSARQSYFVGQRRGAEALLRTETMTQQTP